MGLVSKKVIKKSKNKVAAKVVKAVSAPKAAKPVVLTVPKDRAVPRPLHSPAKTTMRIILEHVYWLGDALKDGDQARAQREVDELARWAKHYRVFAGSPANQKIKYSSSAEEYGKDKRKSRLGQIAEKDDEEELDMAD